MLSQHTKEFIALVALSLLVAAAGLACFYDGYSTGYRAGLRHAQEMAPQAEVAQ
jgi:hypothetical protein